MLTSEVRIRQSMASMLYLWSSDLSTKHLNHWYMHMYYNRCKIKSAKTIVLILYKVIWPFYAVQVKLTDIQIKLGHSQTKWKFYCFRFFNLKNETWRLTKSLRYNNQFVLILHLPFFPKLITVPLSVAISSAYSWWQRSNSLILVIRVLWIKR